jgi:hypothetical protein
MTSGVILVLLYERKYCRSAGVRICRKPVGPCVRDNGSRCVLGQTTEKHLIAIAEVYTRVLSGDHQGSHLERAQLLAGD